ncbi:MAG: TonB-dependent receptor [Rhodocyclales bacterium]|nr:TonB-dependent receptor [Rhodocyclales bacterium]
MYLPITHLHPRPIALTVVAMLAAPGLCVAADTPETAAVLPEMAIMADKPALPANVPNTVESVTKKQIDESINAVTTASVLQYLPSMHVRERYIGDRNGVLVMRVNSSIASAQTTVYADGLLLSNFLNNSFSTAPRWGMVAPEEIERIDVMYGPFSALYPGNSAGGVVNIATRMPEKFEFHAKVDYFTQHFKQYKADGNFDGDHGSVSLGNKMGNWSFWAALDHLDNHGQPQTFGTATRKSGAAAGAGTFTVVSGEVRDIDTSGNPRIITSTTGMDHTVQDNGKFKIAYDITPTLRASYILGLWQNKSDTTVDPYLKDAAGNFVYGTRTGASPFQYVRIGGLDYTVSTASPAYSESEHWMHGLSLKSATGGAWDWEAIASYYNQEKDISRTATNFGYDSGLGPVRPGGNITLADGTGWRNLDLRGEWRPGGDLKSAHQVSFGYHHDRYILDSDTYSIATDWLNGAPGTLSTNSRGKTETQALYLQDAWQFHPDWKLTAGGRFERWKAFDGSNYNAANLAPNATNQVYADRAQSNFSPKLSLAFQAAPDWLLRGSLGKAYRYPTVSEMFQSISLPGSVKFNDPNLKPEHVLSSEFTAEKSFANALWRTSLFWEDKRDALISQTDVTVTPTISSIQNVDRVRTRGLETSMQANDLWIRGLDLSGSITYTDSFILKDARNPGLEGTKQPRIPDWRATLVGIYRASDRLSYSLAARYSGRQHNALFNTTTRQYNDINPNVYGAVSSYTVVDGKVVYKVDKQWTAAFGVNNLFSYKYYVNPNPYPQRTWLASLKFDY